MIRFASDIGIRNDRCCVLAYRAEPNGLHIVDVAWLYPTEVVEDRGDHFVSFFAFDCDNEKAP